MNKDRKYIKSITLDFDGVIHPYNKPFDPNSCPEPPEEEVNKSIQKIRSMGFEVYVLSTRCETPHGVQLIRDYLKTHNIEVDDVVSTKERSKVYVDDRGYRFTGNWDKLVNFLSDEENYRPHNKKKESHTSFRDLCELEYRSSDLGRDYSKASPLDIAHIEKIVKEKIKYYEDYLRNN